MKYIVWDDEENEIIRENYNKLPASEIATLCNALHGSPVRTPGSVKTQAVKLGVTGGAKEFIKHGGRTSNKNNLGSIDSEIRNMATSMSWGVRK